jgi:hypothetical protein
MAAEDRIHGLEKCGLEVGGQLQVLAHPEL